MPGPAFERFQVDCSLVGIQLHRLDCWDAAERLVVGVVDVPCVVIDVLLQLSLAHSVLYVHIVCLPKSAITPGFYIHLLVFKEATLASGPVAVGVAVLTLDQVACAQDGLLDTASTVATANLHFTREVWDGCGLLPF